MQKCLSGWKAFNTWLILALELDWTAQIVLESSSM
jgi:hypothetical protein